MSKAQAMNAGPAEKSEADEHVHYKKTAGADMMTPSYEKMRRNVIEAVVRMQHGSATPVSKGK